ncbi:ornithine carbamoyltransferase [Parashewanella spongiae]|uniref:Ornithine carbamoyltransferase n=1 Tax=Parashewanella spongiae TaxID=342950 RepID=A0A3A6TP22_9GAMM|nr:ornithine carbamoyltransferase [Parashewanella spongiae]MCL1077079.1 ornithine carbamoyltransferase [Parashewanella spongiae]RJY17684.1 ornithine carbamoyltransferase [Parashewanella spongiae]
MSYSHFLADDQFNKAQLLELINLAKNIKQSPQNYQQALAGKSVVMLFEKPSLRTHISFDIGIQKLGGHSVYIGQQNGKLGERERVIDVAKNLACWSDAIVARVFNQKSLEELAEYAGIPVINALSDLYHPCQALADFLTLAEQTDDLSSVKLAYVGDPNNVSNSLMLMALTLGIDFTLVCPKEVGISTAMLAQTKTVSAQSGAKFTQIHDIDSIGEQTAIYTDTWISMGDDKDTQQILKTFMPYQVNHQLVKKTSARFVMHCQPAHLNQEITQELFDSKFSVATEQAENRMWAQCAVLLTLFIQ